MITKEDRATLWTLWKSEDPEDGEWREHLNEEQLALVRLWDWAYDDGLAQMTADHQAAMERKMHYA